MRRDEIWTKSVAVGSEDFVRRTRQRIGLKVKGRKIVEKGTHKYNAVPIFPRVVQLWIILYQFLPYIIE